MSTSDLLRRCIRELIEEVRDVPRVGDQLKNADGSPESGEDDSDEDEKEVDEMNVTANIAGPMLPLGMKTPGKKKKPGWR